METIKDRIYCMKLGLIRKVEAMIKDKKNIVFHQCKAADKIIEHVEGDGDDTLIITLKDAYIPHEERDYIIMFNGTSIPADKLEIYGDTDNNNACRIVYYDENMQEQYFNITCARYEYFYLSSIDDSDEKFEIKIMELPPWYLSNIMDAEKLLDIFPVVVSEDSVKQHPKTGKYFYYTEVFAYLNPFVPNKTFVKCIASGIKNLSIHNSKVRLAIDNFANVNTLALVSGAVIYINNPQHDNHGLYEVESLYDSIITCIKITEDVEPEKRTILPIHVGALESYNVSILYPTENIFSYSAFNHEIKMLHNGLFKDGSIDSMDKVLEIIEVMKDYDTFVLNYSDKVSDAIASLEPSENIADNDIISRLLKLYHKATPCIDNFKSIMTELSDKVINVYMVDDDKLYKLSFHDFHEMYTMLDDVITEINKNLGNIVQL